jgi:hypothetical protein
MRSKGILLVSGSMLLMGTNNSFDGLPATKAAGNEFWGSHAVSSGLRQLSIEDRDAASVGGGLPSLTYSRAIRNDQNQL